MKTAKKDAPGNAVKNIEVLTRAYTVRDIEIREDNETRDGFTVLSGHAALFNTMSEDLGGFIEVIRPGAFAKTIAESDVRAHWNHERKYVLGRTKPGTLRLREDEIGLAFEIDLPDTRWAQDLAISIKRGDIDQMSFRVSSNTRSMDKPGKPAGFARIDRGPIVRNFPGYLPGLSINKC